MTEILSTILICVFIAFCSGTSLAMFMRGLVIFWTTIGILMKQGIQTEGFLIINDMKDPRTGQRLPGWDLIFCLTAGPTRSILPAGPMRIFFTGIILPGWGARIPGNHCSLM